ncbi:MAG: exo-alpha-sialidase [Candidatus Hydrogenedentes bacterium]|nr:exo-alpha-sialidase [Candidatus Hydrogenedentota bacterium]
MPTRRADRSPGEFLRTVEAAGGRVDFVFADERPFKECHASTLVEAGDGALLCAWFGGDKEKADNVAIWMSRFKNKTWAMPVKVAKVNETAHWNPVLFRDPANGTYLFFKVGREIPFWETNWMQTKDDGHTWSEARELVAHDQGGRGPVRSKPIILHDKSWLAGASTEYKGWNAFADRSQDGGRTWVRSADWQIDKTVIAGDGAIQPTLWESSPGHVHAFVRTAAGFIGRVDSADGGRTWSPVHKTDLPNNNSGIDVLKLDDGKLVLIYNPVGKSWGSRSPLNLALSSDNGATWTDLAALEDEPEMEFSYPAVVRTKNGIAVSYTWKRERVRVWQIPLTALAR